MSETIETENNIENKQKNKMNLPTKLTFLRIFLIPVFVVLFFLPFPYLRFGAVAVFMLASFTDYLDGHIARKYNMVTNLGKFLDPIADKMLVACALIVVSLSVEAPLSPLDQILIATCAMIILCRELFVSGFRIVAASRNLVLAADKLGKIKTVLQMIALILLLPYSNIVALDELVGKIFLYAGLAFLALATVMTVVSGANYIIKNKQVLKD